MKHLIITLILSIILTSNLYPENVRYNNEIKTIKTENYNKQSHLEQLGLHGKVKRIETTGYLDYQRNNEVGCHIIKKFNEEGNITHIKGADSFHDYIEEFKNKYLQRYIIDDRALKLGSTGASNDQLQYFQIGKIDYNRRYYGEVNFEYSNGNLLNISGENQGGLLEWRFEYNNNDRVSNKKIICNSRNGYGASYYNNYKIENVWNNGRLVKKIHYWGNGDIHKKIKILYQKNKEILEVSESQFDDRRLFYKYKIINHYNGDNQLTKSVKAEYTDHFDGPVWNRKQTLSYTYSDKYITQINITTQLNKEEVSLAYDDDGISYSEINISRDEHGMITSIGKPGIQDWTHYKWVYQYDNFGNWTERKRIDKDNNKCHQIIKRKIEYYPGQFSRSKQIIRYPRRKDVANVFWKPKYTLFCKLTDEPIFPDEHGVYDLWYASNEEPYPHHKTISTDEMSNLRFYKFKDYEACKKWCEMKKSNQLNDDKQNKQNEQTSLSTLIIEGNQIWIREKPSTGEVIMKLNTGDRCQVLEKGKFEEIRNMYDYWYKIKYNGRIGWVYGSQSNLKTGYTHADAVREGLINEKESDQPVSYTIEDFIRKYLSNSKKINQYIHKSIGLNILKNPGARCYGYSSSSVRMDDLNIQSGNIYQEIPKGDHCSGYENSKDGFYYEKINRNALPIYSEDGENIIKLSTPNNYLNNEVIKVCIIRNQSWIADFYFIKIQGRAYIICQDFCDCSA